MKYPEGLRVKAVSGDGKTELGLGTYTGDVHVYIFETEDGIVSLDNAEQEPSQEIIDYIVSTTGATPLEMYDNPRIILDNGKVVYGCQVWWQPVGEIEL